MNKKLCVIVLMGTLSKMAISSDKLNLDLFLKNPNEQTREDDVVDRPIVVGYRPVCLDAIDCYERIDDILKYYDRATA